MNRILKIGMDVHSTNYTLCAMEISPSVTDRVITTTQIGPNYKLVIKFIEQLKKQLGEKDTYDIVCGYEAGCLGYSLYHDLTKAGINCVILAPTTMLSQQGKRIKNDKRDALLIAQCLAHNTYSSVFVTSEKDVAVRDYIRMRDDHKRMLKSLKHQICGLCLRNGFHYDPNRQKWTLLHLKWLREIELSPMVREVLDEYLVTYETLVSSIERHDKHIQEIAEDEYYKERVQNLCSLLGIQTYTAAALLAEVGDFKRFPSANAFASYIGLCPGESSSGMHICRTGITKAGNKHLRTLLIESATGICQGRIGYKSKNLKARQANCTADIVGYADRANIRLRSRYYKLIKKGKKRQIAVTAVARELAGFVWGMMVGELNIV